ncbi:MAG TPA: FkbM family methyltransferase [Candidatus Caenarcaniphilales bacterium]|nr:FkbM family methyltransferase [Candidatus Caenarcaniphilales bacterium]
MTTHPRRPRVAPAAERRRVPLHYLVESAARVAFAYLRNQHGLRDRRPLPRFLARTARFLVAGRRQPFIEAEMSGLRVLLPTADRTIARSVFASGDWDPLLVGTALEALDEFRHDVRGTVFLEIGANFGVYALPAVAEMGFASAVAYEPDPASFALLEANIERNGLAGRVQAVNAALSDRPGELTLSRSPTNAGDNRIVAESDAQLGSTGSVKVRAATFDAEVEAGIIPLCDVGLVWLDVQGHESQVLSGATTLLESDVPVVLEYSSRMMGADDRPVLDELIADCYDVLVDLGWSALTNRVRFQPAAAIRSLVRRGQALETDLLLLKNP